MRVKEEEVEEEEGKIKVSEGETVSYCEYLINGSNGRLALCLRTPAKSVRMWPPTLG